MATLVEKFGEMWARNKKNIDSVPGSKEGGRGVYVLYDGSMPVYIGKGNIRSRLRTSSRSTWRGEFWDYFSWYIIPNPKLRHDVEALFLRTLPWYVRTLNKQSGKFTDGRESETEQNKNPQRITRRRPRTPRN